MKVFTVLLKENYIGAFDLIKIFSKFGDNICQTLSFFQGLSGCDTSSSFNGKGKPTFWDALMSFSKSRELTYTFIELGNSQLTISKENKRLLELFILYVYFGKDQR